MNFITVLFLIFCVQLMAQKESDLALDYQVNKLDMKSEFREIKVNPKDFNPLYANVGRLENLNIIVKNHMSLWVKMVKENTPTSVEWEVIIPSSASYHFTAGTDAVGTEYTLKCNGKVVSTIVGKEKGFEIMDFGDVPLKKGRCTIRLEMNKASLDQRFSHITLTETKYHEAALKRAFKEKQQPEWFKNAGYGLMFQWTNRATPLTGPIKEWEQKVNDFKLDAFLELVDASGAKYVLWSVTWGNQYISAPIKSLDKLIAGRTTKRDLLGEMADALHQRGVKLIFYYHYGYDCGHSIDAEWMKACGGYRTDKTFLFNNWMKIIAEIGDRYGDKLHGWWFDGGERYHNCHFDGSPADQGILTAPFEKMTQAARAGNPERMVSYNSFFKPRLTDFQDYYGGEGARSFNPSDLKNGVFHSGRKTGLQAHGCFTFDGRWGRFGNNNKVIPEPKFSLEVLEKIVIGARKNKAPISMDLEMYEDGTVSPQSLSLLKELNSKVN